MDNVLSQKEAFSYKYSAAENKEIQEIRKRYLPQSESKLDELKRLDAQVQNSGMVEALGAGIGGCLILGLGMSLAMQVLGSGIMTMVIGVAIGIIGIAGMLIAYPICKTRQRKAKEKLTPRILELVEELSQRDAM